MAQQEPKPAAQVPSMEPPLESHSDPLRHTPCTSLVTLGHKLYHVNNRDTTLVPLTMHSSFGNFVTWNTLNTFPFLVLFTPATAAARLRRVTLTIAG